MSATRNAPANQGGKPATDAVYHAMAVADVIDTLRTSIDTGLSTDEANVRLARYGPNLLPKAHGDTAWTLLWRQINSPLIWVLIASGFVAMLVDPTHGLKNGMVILAVVVLNTLIGFVQEFKAGKAIEALSKMVPESVTALRDGKKAVVAGADLVPGDVILLASGDKVPADLRLVAARTLKIEEAALTGESVPAEKNTDACATNAGIGDRSGMAFGGTLVTYGTATAIVCGTGAATELGRISTLLKEATDLQTPLTKALQSIGKYITIGIVVIAAIMLVVGTWRAMAETGVAFLPALRETVIFAIALAVGAIPEGLPAIVTIALAIGVQRMAARRAVIRKLPAVETLGSTTTICSDKTGTLTRNEMTVQALWTPRGSYSITGVGYAPAGQIRDASGGEVTGKDLTDVHDLLLAGVLCNDATLVQEASSFKITGDPTEAALVVSAAKIGMHVEDARRNHARLDAIPFESENQFMATLNQHPGASPRIILKGAPEVILKRCEGIDMAPVLAAVSLLAGQGMRVLAVASRVTAQTGPLQLPDTTDGFTLLGLQGMIDPPRSEAIAAIQACHAAGITVKMITGDHKETAQAIGAQLNILTDDKAVTGAQLAGMSDEQLRQVVRTTNVFARVAPEHKLRLVKALQSNHQVVAMTGDGVNDAPALKQSNIGVAMGITGTAVSKEAADIVLTDDNFASIAAAVEEGRRVYDNLIKSLVFVLPTNLGLAMILMAAVIFFPFLLNPASGLKELLLPMAPTQLLWINLVATVALALPLAFEAKEPNVMQRPPRSPDAPVLSGFVVMRTFVAATLMTIGAVGLFLWEYHANGETLDAMKKGQTMAVTTVIMFQVFYVLNCRSLKDSLLSIGLWSNMTVFIGIAALLLLQAGFIYLPFMNAIFDSLPLSARDLLVATAVGMIILPAISVEKLLRNRLETGRTNP
jgi:potassium/sodium efflux P-type ATPase